MASKSEPVRGPSLLVELDRGGGVPLHEQVERSVREAIHAGRLTAGARLPSTRMLATELGVSRGVVIEAYSQLSAEGYLLSRQGAPVRVARSVRTPAAREPAGTLLPSFPYHFHPGLPDLAGFPRDRWLRSLRAALRQAPHGALGYPDPRGAPELRETLAAYLGRARGAAADPEQMVVCSGFAQGLSLICRWLRERGVERIALEDPGWHAHRLIAAQAGLQIVPVPVDSEGIQVELLERAEAPAVVVTPAHQFPTGRVLSRRRRAALVEWAEAGERLVIEDDFDAELRYDGGTVGAVQGLAPERVVYICSASKRLFPGIRLAGMLLPSWLAWGLVASKSVEDAGAEVLSQLALHDFIVRGELDRHIRRMRQRYQRRREALLGAFALHLPDCRVGDGAAGLYELVELPADVAEPALLGAAERRGVGLEGLSMHRYAAGGTPGLVLGFGNLSEPAIEHGVRLLADAVAETRTEGQRQRS